MSNSWARKPLGGDKCDIVITCTKEQEEIIKKAGCIAYNDKCDAAFCDTCAYNSDKVTFKIVKEQKKEEPKLKSSVRMKRNLKLYTMKSYLRQWTISGKYTKNRNKRIIVDGESIKINKLYPSYDRCVENIIRRDIDANFNKYYEYITEHKYADSVAYYFAAGLTGSVLFSLEGEKVLNRSEILKYLKELNVKPYKRKPLPQMAEAAFWYIDDSLKYWWAWKRDEFVNVRTWKEEQKMREMEGLMRVWMSWLFKDMSLEIMYNDTNLDFITSSNPVMHAFDTIIHIISPRVALIFRDDPKRRKEVTRRHEDRKYIIEGINDRIKNHKLLYTVEKQVQYTT